MKLTKSQLKKIIKEELGDPEGEAEYEREKKARIAWKRKFTSVEEVEAIVDLMINDPEFQMLQGYAEEFKRRSQRGTPPQDALEGILPEYVPGGLISTIVVKARERLPADETRIERPKGTGASAADMERWQSDYHNESKQNTKMKLTKSQLKQIIKEELETLNETSNTDPTKILGDMHVRLEPYLDQLSDIAEDNPTPEGKFLRKLWTELNMWHQTSYKYKALGEHR
tara:strand:- start:155 stop:835 length:681 start_codon:yes stop_codon:yes gene_type:complete